MMEAPFSLTIPTGPPACTVPPAESPPPSATSGLISPHDISRNLAAFIQQHNGNFSSTQAVLDGLCSSVGSDPNDIQRHPNIQAALSQFGFTSLAGLASPPPTSIPSMAAVTPKAELSCDYGLPSSLPAPIATSAPYAFMDTSSTVPSLNLTSSTPSSLPIPSTTAPPMHTALHGLLPPPTPGAQTPQSGFIQQVPCQDIVTVQPRYFRKPPASGGRGSVGLAVHVDGYLYHGKKTRLDGTKLLYCLDRTKYNCMAVAELFPNGTFRAKRPHTGHPPNPEECEVRLAKRMMRERAREHPEFTSKEIIQDMINDPSLSEEAKKRLENYESLRKFVYRGRQQHTRRPKLEPQDAMSPIKMEDAPSAFSLPTSLAALLSQNLQNLATVTSQSSMSPFSHLIKQEPMMAPSIPVSMPNAMLPPLTPHHLQPAETEIARLMRELQAQNARTVEEIKFAPIEPSTSNASSVTVSTVSAHHHHPFSNHGVWHTVDCDIINFSGHADGEFAYIFHAKDSVSRFSFACPLMSASRAEVLDALRELFFTYGPAHVVRIDEAYKCSDLEKELSEHFPLTAVEYIVARKNPQGALIQRREAAMMRERITAWLMETRRTDWARALPQIKYTHNTEWIDEIECTPLEKFFSRNLPTGMSSRCSEENNESHDGMSEDGEEIVVTSQSTSPIEAHYSDVPMDTMARRV